VELLGPLGLFAIVSDGPTSSGRPTLVGLNNAADHHIGPCRLWVDWGRQMAARGWAFARIDIPGVGDSPTAPAERDDRPYPTDGVEHIVAACRELGDAGVVLIGLCSGSRHALEAAAVLPARGVIAINAALHTPRRLLSGLAIGATYSEKLRKLNNQRVRGRLRRATPSVVWRIVYSNRRGPEPIHTLFDLRDAGTDILLCYGTGAYELWKARETMRWAFKALSKRPGFEIVTVPGFDHAAMRYGPRLAMVHAMTAHLEARFARPEPLPPAAASRAANAVNA
jgi:pimeloyl-ACP methyl ester carboxylesterase